MLYIDTEGAAHGAQGPGEIRINVPPSRPQSPGMLCSRGRRTRSVSCLKIMCLLGPLIFLGLGRHEASSSTTLRQNAMGSLPCSSLSSVDSGGMSGDIMGP